MNVKQNSRDYNVSFQDWSSGPPREFWNLEELSSISVASSKLTILPPEMLTKWNATLETLALPHNEISSFPKELEDSEYFSTTLTRINLSNNRFTTLPHILNRFSNLKSLSLTGNLIPLDDCSSFDLPSTLQIVQLGNMKLNVLPPFLLGLPNLKECSINDNFITKIPIELFENKDSLEHFTAIRNRIEEFPTIDDPSSLNKTNYPTITKLDLSGNKISKLNFTVHIQHHSHQQHHRSTPGSKRNSSSSHHSSSHENENHNHHYRFGNKQIDELIKQHNNNNDSSSSYGETIEMKEIGSHINSLPFSHEISLVPLYFANLRTLYLNNNCLTSLSPLVPLLQEGTLEILQASHNEITCIPIEFCDSSIKFLRSLDLSFNCIDEEGIPVGAFRQMSQLKSLNLAGNNIFEQPAHLNGLKIPNMHVVEPAPGHPNLIIDHLYLGTLTSANNRFLLKRLKITHIVTVLKMDNPAIFPKDFKYFSIPLDDMDTSDIGCYFEAAIKFIDDAITNHGSVLVHCAAGISRSSTVVISYMMYKFKMPLKEALNFVKTRRNQINPNPGFMRQLQQFETKLAQNLHSSGSLSSSHSHFHRRNKSKDVKGEKNSKCIIS